MLNHVRTLLLYDTGQAWHVPGEELLPSDFTPPPLPAYLTLLRTYLFGNDPDRYMRNYRLRQFMALLQASPLAEHVRAFDRRITYSWADEVFTNSALYVPEIVALPSAESLLWQGTPDIPDATGRMYLSYRVRIVSGPRLHIERLTTPALNTDIALGAPAPLPGAGYDVVPANTPTVGDTWLVSVVLRPQWDPGQLVANLRSLGTSTFTTLFAGDSEPYLTYRNLWDNSAETPLVLGSVLMALARRTDEARLGA